MGPVVALGGKSEAGWEQAPVGVEILLCGEAFDDAAFRETGHLQLNFGFDDLYLPDPAEPEPSRHIRANAHLLHTFLRSLEKELPWPSAACGRRAKASSPPASTPSSLPDLPLHLDLFHGKFKMAGGNLCCG
ncbi:MAG: hypothetical protein ACRD35_00405 [Candidatus Acidiferrales bacterium]